MKISSATFLTSAPGLDACPDESLPEVAVIGRSNVGKSSLLNLLAGKRDLARVSGKPGSTQLINFFDIDGRWRLVDLPGYGFAKVARQDRSKFNRAVAEYLAGRPNLAGMLVLIDSMIPPQAIDLEFVEWLAAQPVSFALVFTKIDRSKAKKRQANTDAFLGEIGEWCDPLPEVLSCSAKSGQGRQDLLRQIGRLISRE